VSSGAVITLPIPSVTKVVIKSNTNDNITIISSGLETIDGEGSIIISNRYTSVTLVSDGSNWFII
jgi:hypothetical protein